MAYLAPIKSFNQVNNEIFYSDCLTQQRIISQITSMGASDFRPNGFTWVPDMRYPALITAERKFTAEGDVHFNVAQRLCRLKNKGTSFSSCTG